MSAHDPSLLERARAVRLVALDVDGTLTDGRIHIGPEGEAMKSFSVRDGFGLTLLREAGLKLAIITARESSIVRRRAAELSIGDVVQGARDKAHALAALCAAHELELSQCAFVGDDWPDLPAMAIAGLAAAVGDADAEVRRRAHWVASVGGGRGAVREFAQFLLLARGQWQEALARRTGSAAPVESPAAQPTTSSPGLAAEPPE